jgi:FKBP-type peptidyl-prolyl cis-trans isomerase SlyD
MSPQARTVADGLVVGIYYTLRTEGGEVLDTNRKGGRPLAFLCGAGNILPGLERALVGRSKGDEVRVDLAPGEGYGERREEAVERLERSKLPPGSDPQVGQAVRGSAPDGSAVAARITAVDADWITLDHNHPLAGVRLLFEVTIAGVREPTPEELEHGHPHGPGGHHA